MALYLPPAVSVQKFVGGYKSVSDYTDLADTETNDSENVLYGTNGSLEQRLGSEKLYNKKLTNTSSTSVGEPITGHYFFDKLGSTQTVSVVAAGNAVYQYTSATASAIVTGLTDNSEAFFSFCQVEDPRSASDEILLMTNGVDDIYTWNASSTAVKLSSFTSASAVPKCKYLLTHKRRVYALNIIDAADADAAVKVVISGFGAVDGAADPHRFSEGAGGGTFYCGGAGKQGDIRGGKILNDQVIIYTRKSVWKFNPGAGSIIDTSNLQQMQESIGLYAPFSLVDVGNFHIFLAEQGVYAFDGVNFVPLSDKVDNEFFLNANAEQLELAKGVYDKQENQYKLYFAYGESSRNNRCLIYDLKIKAWQPPVTGREVSYISTFDNLDGIEKVIYGDYKGYLYEDEKGDNDGIGIGYNGTVTTAGTYSTLVDSSASFPTTNDGLSGLMVKIYEGTGKDQSRIITSNTSNTLNIESDWAFPPDTTSKYTVAGIDAYWRSKDYEFGNYDILKLFRHAFVRAREQGNYNLTLHYIVDFKRLDEATSKNLLLLDGSMAWGLGTWGNDRWGQKKTIRRKVSFRNTASQRVNGNNLALRFSNRKANETFRISGFDIELKAIGKR